MLTSVVAIENKEISKKTISSRILINAQTRNVNHSRNQSERLRIPIFWNNQGCNDCLHTNKEESSILWE